MKTSHTVRIGLILVAVFLLLRSAVSAQDSGADFSFTPETYRLQIKVTPTALLWPRYPSIQGGVEYRIGKATTITHELGGFFFPETTSLFGDRREAVSGYRLRTGVRWYVGGHYADRADLYLGLQMQFKQEFRDQSTFVNRFGGVFQELITYKEVDNYAGLLMVVGVQGRMTENSRWETDIAIGMRNRWKTFRQLPEDVSNPEFNDFEEFQDLFPDLFYAASLNFRFNFLIPAKEKRRKRSRRR